MPTTRPPSANTEREGVHTVGLIAARLGWAFREQTVEDYGIDAQVEVFDTDGGATGKLIALQIKSGRAKYFAVESDEGWTHYVERKHADYWLKHSLPVVVVLYDEFADRAYWQQVTPSTLLPTPTKYKVLVPRSQEMVQGSAQALREVASGDQYTVRIRKLQLSLPWMQLLRNGRRILLEADEWVNKTSGRGDVTIVSVDEANEDRQLLGTWTIIAPNRLYEDVLPALVPWADVDVHEETYAIDDYDAWTAECVYHDGEGELIMTETFEDWSIRRPRHGLRPYSNGAGEVDHWRLELKLNELGNAFALVNEFASGVGLLLAPEQ